MFYTAGVSWIHPRFTTLQITANPLFISGRKIFTYQVRKDMQMKCCPILLNYQTLQKSYNYRQTESFLVNSSAEWNHNQNELSDDQIHILLVSHCRVLSSKTNSPFVKFTNHHSLLPTEKSALASSIIFLTSATALLNLLKNILEYNTWHLSTAVYFPFHIAEP